MPENISDKISVVIPTYNGIAYIKDCLDSINRQTLTPHEIIVVDDCSTDGTASLIEMSFPEVTCVRLAPNRGFAAAVNEGIRRSSGDLIALLNNDTSADPQWLEELAGTLMQNPSAGSCSSKMLFADRPDIINSIGIGFTSTGMATDVGRGQRDGERFQSPRRIFGACAGAAMYRKRLFDEIGLFDEDLFMWYEDVDLSFRAQLAGRPCMYAPNAVVHHVGGGTASSSNKLRLHYCSRNRVLVLVKNLPRSFRARYFRRLSIICLKHAIKAMLQGKPAVAGGYLAALRDLKLFITKHKATENMAVVSDADIERLLALDTAGIEA